jgi:serine/threonine protein kinase/tetratricopeptide (TPR) repeat protein
MLRSPDMPTDFQLVQSVFQAVAELPPAERAAVLERECGGDAELRRRVEALLQAHDGCGELPAAEHEPTGAYVAGVASDQVFAGRYKLRQKLGEGGMGVVFVADQTEPVRRRVALKIIRAGLETQRLLARFEQERQALALMDHPNIAKVFDAGMDQAQRPYFAMELVKGLPLTRYCDEARLSPRQRLKLFIPVCQAVQHAHQKGIIHRDLKPSNILVGMYDGRPVPKVIDFGVAKATGPRLTDQSVYTEVGTIIGTLEYMAPEQAELNNLDIDTRSDVYALGVILYELLTGDVPFSRKELERTGLAEMLRVIKEAEPTRPSTKLSHSGTLPSIAAHRQMEPHKLTALVRGELDWIVMKALEKDRGRRYESANSFAMDVQRYLAGEPVQAAPASAMYRLRKLVRRHRGPVVAAVLVLLTLLGGIAGTTWGLVRAEQQRQLADAKAQEAVDERDAKATALRAEQQARADETRARKLAEAKEREAAGERDAKATALKAEQQAREGETRARQRAFAALRSMTADVVERKFAQATVLTADDRAFLRGVIAQYDAFAAIQADDADSRALRAEGRLRVGSMRHRLGELKEAEQDLGQALGLFKQLAADFPSRPEFRHGLALSHFNRGPLLRATGRPREGEQDYDQAVRLFKELVGEAPSNPEFRDELARTHNNRAMLRSATGRPKEAEKDHDEALSIQKQLAADFPARPEFREELALSHSNRGVLLWEAGRPDEAERDFDQALRIRKQLAAEFPGRPQHRQDLAMSYNNRGNLLRARGRPEEAVKYYDQTLSLRRQLVADYPTRPEFRKDLGRSHYNRADLLRAVGRPTEAAKDYDQALSLFKQLAADFPSRPEFRQELAQTLNGRGGLLAATGRPREAGIEFDKALSLYRQLAADFPNQPDVRNYLAGICVNRARLHQQQGDWAAAKRLLLESRPHHLAALKAKPGHPLYRQFYRSHLRLLTEVHAGLLERDDAVSTAKTWQDLGGNAAANAYDAACALSRCVAIVAQHNELDDRQRKEAAQFYGDAAVKLLRVAVNKGYKNVVPMMRSTDLDPLRPREDFGKLVAELEGKGK